MKTLLLGITFLCIPFTYAEKPPSVMLAQTYAGQNVAGWLASEKLDGVRGFWDGEKFYSRNGKLLTFPASFTTNFPPFPLDGELFGGRGKFAQTSSIIRRGEDWSEITFHVFDLPQAKGGLLQRLDILREWLKHHPTDKIVIIKQTPIKNITQAREMLTAVEKQGGEGLIIRNPNLPYIAGRNASLLKLKTTDDAECIVSAHHMGKGKYQNMLGSISCRLADGQIIRIGSGFHDSERKNPPAIGQVITFRYRGLTKTGKPRFATYWRERSDLDLSQ